MLAEGVDLRLGWANERPWPDGSFDRVDPSDTFHYVTAPEGAVRATKRVLAPARLTQAASPPLFGLPVTRFGADVPWFSAGLTLFACGALLFLRTPHSRGGS